jgi:two-component system, NarL family, response regulator NreC
MDSYRVIIADDHALFRQGLRSLIEQARGLEVVGEAEDGLHLLRLLNEVIADIILLDITMPNLRGIDAIPRIKMIQPAVKILIVTMHDDTEFLYRAISAGADGYFLKKAVDKELFAAIGQVRQGRVYVSPLVSREFGGDWGRLRERFQKSLLTEREKEVLNLIAEGKSNKEIATLLYISVHTVERHRANIMAKLDLHTLAELLKYAIEKKFA